MEGLMEQRGLTAKPWYTPAFLCYLNSVNRNEVYMNYFQTKADALGLGLVESVLTIGPGDGVFECELLHKLMKSCTECFGVEPNPDFGQMLQSNMRTRCPGIQTTLVSSLVQNWSGPPKPVDLILLNNVVYYFKGENECLEIFRHCLNWLKPDGKMIVILSTADVGVRKAARDLGTCYDVYTYPQMINDFNKLNIDYTEDLVLTDLDWSHEDKYLADMFWQKDTTHEEATTLYKYLDANYPEKRETVKYMINIVSKRSGGNN